MDVDAAQEAAALAVLERLGYVIDTDWCPNPVDSSQQGEPEFQGTPRDGSAGGRQQRVDHELGDEPGELCRRPSAIEDQ